MSALPPTRRDAAPESSAIRADQSRLICLLAEVRRLIAVAYPDHEPYLVAYPKKDGGRVLRLLCPDLYVDPPAPTPDPPPADGSNADLIRTVLEEADRPLTVVEIGFKATGGEPTGALRKALRKMVADKIVTEHPGPPKTYELS